MLESFNEAVDFPSAASHPNVQLTKLYDSDRYTAYTQDLEFMWHWTIYQENKLIQEGCSLSLDSSKHAVQHVMAFITMSDKN
jgi:methane monooxygenase component D